MTMKTSINIIKNVLDFLEDRFNYSPKQIIINKKDLEVLFNTTLPKDFLPGILNTLNHLGHNYYYKDNATHYLIEER